MDELGLCFRCGRCCDVDEYMATVPPIGEWLCAMCAEYAAAKIRQEGNDQI